MCSSIRRIRFDTCRSLDEQNDKIVIDKFEGDLEILRKRKNMKKIKRHRESLAVDRFRPSLSQTWKILLYSFRRTDISRETRNENYREIGDFPRE